METKFKVGDVLRFEKESTGKVYIFAILSHDSNGRDISYEVLPIKGNYMDLNGGYKTDFTFSSYSNIGLKAKVIGKVGKLTNYLYAT